MRWPCCVHFALVFNQSNLDLANPSRPGPLEYAMNHVTTHCSFIVTLGNGRQCTGRMTQDNILSRLKTYSNGEEKIFPHVWVNLKLTRFLLKRVIDCFSSQVLFIRICLKEVS